jgi:hypothetical protein
VGPVISESSELRELREVVLEPQRRPRSQLSDSGTALDVCFNQKRIVTGTVNSDVKNGPLAVL